MSDTCNAVHDDRPRVDPMAEWRENRAPGWYRDLGYALQEVIQAHRYDYKNKGCKPDDPGWHSCSCGEWEGYWSGFEPHVADHLRDAVTRAQGAPPDTSRDDA